MKLYAGPRPLRPPRQELHHLQTGAFESHLRHHCLDRFTAGRARGDAPERAVKLYAGPRPLRTPSARAPHHLQTGAFESHLRHHCLERFTAGRARGDAPERGVKLYAVRRPLRNPPGGGGGEDAGAAGQGGGVGGAPPRQELHRLQCSLVLFRGSGDLHRAWGRVRGESGVGEQLVCSRAANRHQPTRAESSSAPPPCCDALPGGAALSVRGGTPSLTSRAVPGTGAMLPCSESAPPYPGGVKLRPYGMLGCPARRGGPQRQWRSKVTGSFHGLTRNTWPNTGPLTVTSIRFSLPSWLGLTSRMTLLNCSSCSPGTVKRGCPRGLRPCRCTATPRP